MAGDFPTKARHVTAEECERVYAERDRLREENERLHADFLAAVMRLGTDLSDAYAERDRHRDALRELVEGIEVGGVVDNADPRYLRARALLEEDEP